MVLLYTVGGDINFSFGENNSAVSKLKIKSKKLPINLIVLPLGLRLVQRCIYFSIFPLKISYWHMIHNHVIHPFKVYTFMVAIHRSGLTSPQ